MNKSTWELAKRIVWDWLSVDCHERKEVCDNMAGSMKLTQRVYNAMETGYAKGVEDAIKVLEKGLPQSYYDKRAQYKAYPNSYPQPPTETDLLVKNMQKLLEEE